MDKNKNSLPTSGRLLVLSLAVVVLWPSLLRADSVIQMNLREMCRRADKVFRGTVIGATPGTLQVGGGELPIVTYHIRVEEAFKGDFQELKGSRFAEVRMLTPGQFKEGAPSRAGTRLLGPPRLEVGKPYLLLLTRPSAIGLSAPVGLGQGCFHINGEGGGEEAVNEYGNKLLFKGMGSDDRRAIGPLSYARLAERIRGLIREERGKR